MPPYAAVIDIDPAKLPAAGDGRRLVGGAICRRTAARSDCPAFNPHLRQLIHVGYKIAAQMGEHYLQILEKCEPAISRNVTENLYDRHLKPYLLTGENRSV